MKNNEQIESEVPLIITNKLNRKRQVLFRVGEHKMPKDNQPIQLVNNQIAVNAENRNRTVSKRQKSVIITRARRISSSAASKRFPKDFFRAEPCNQSVSMTQKAKNQQTVNMLDTFSQKCIPIRIQQQSNNNNICKNEMTPQFRLKKQYINNKKVYLNSQRNNRKHEQLPKLHQFFSSKQEALQLSKVSKKCVKDEPISRQMKQITPQLSNFNLTLGQRLNMALLFKRDKEKKRVTKLKQKQNSVSLPFVLNGITLRKGEDGYPKISKM